MTSSDKMQSLQISGNMLRSNLVGWNTSYLCTFQGILNIFQVVICYTVVALITEACRPAYASSPGGFVGAAYDTYFFIASNVCLAITSIILFCFVISQASFALMGRTIVIFVFWIICFLCSIITSIFLLISIVHPYPRDLEIYGYTSKITSSVLGIINAFLYLTSCFQAFKTFKNSWMSLGSQTLRN